MTTMLESSVKTTAPYQPKYSQGKEAILRGYDISELDPYNIPGNGDKQPIFDDKAADECFTFNEIKHTELSATEEEYYSLYDFYSSQSQTVKTGLSIPLLFSFETQFTLNKISSLTRSERTAITSSTVSYQSFSAGWTPFSETEPQLSNDFVNAVINLPTTYSDKDEHIQKFLKWYGTHYAIHAVMGGKASYFRCYNKEQIKQMESVGLSVGAGVKAEVEEVALNVGSSMTDEQKKVYESVKSSSHEYKQYTGGIGYTPDFHKYLESIKGNESAISIDLALITTLFDKAPLKNLENITVKKEVLDEAIKKYLESKKHILDECEDFTVASGIEKATHISGDFRNPSVASIKLQASKTCSKNERKVFCVFTKGQKDSGSLYYLESKIGTTPDANNATPFKDGGEHITAEMPCVSSKDNLVFTFYRNPNGGISYVPGEYENGKFFPGQAQILTVDQQAIEVSASFVGDKIAVAWKDPSTSTLCCKVYSLSKEYTLTEVAEVKGLGEGRYPSIAGIGHSEFVVVYQDNSTHELYNSTLRLLANTIEYLSEPTKFGVGGAPKVAGIQAPSQIGDTFVECSSIIEVHYNGDKAQYRLGDIGPNWEINWKGGDEGHYYDDGYRPSVATFSSEQVVIYHNGRSEHDNLWYHEGVIE